jgi:FKBP-type peptidyl-prolyl cis-trans isomerase FkpA
MKNSILALLLLATTGLLAQTGKALTSKHGYRAVLHHDAGKAKAQFGDEFLAHVAVFIGDSLMQDTRRTSPAGFEAPLPSEAEFNGSPSMPILVDVAFLMGPGDSLTGYMPLDSFIRTTLPPALRSFTEARFEIKMLGLTTAAEKRLAIEAIQKRVPEIEKELASVAAQFRAGTLQTINTPSGLKYFVVDPGKGNNISVGARVSAHYYGALKDATMFDNSYSRGEPIEFTTGVGQMIPGFEEGVLALKQGGKAYLFIPPTLGYGENAQGPIPANSDLIFYIEIQ